MSILRLKDAFQTTLGPYQSKSKMNYTTTIKVGFDPALLKSFEAEDKKGDRSSYEVSQEQKKIIFTITSTDATALKATLNSITKLLIVNEKVEKI